jgi:uncharacterized protein YjbJ (UPF0337 family)
MNWDQTKGNWHQIKGKVRTEWGKLTDDDLVAIDGKREQLLGKLQEKYGIAKEEAEKQMDGFLKKIKQPHPSLD